ncbi:hypothetical protein RCL1_002835 [Eukaryota sp. TZLM3-RCL]
MVNFQLSQFPSQLWTPVYSSDDVTVYKVIQKPTRRKFALKVIARSCPSCSREKVRLLFKDPNIVLLHAVFKDDDKAYFLMDFYEFTLEQILHPDIDYYRATKFFIQIFDAIDNLHSQGIAHRDVKASNVLVDENDNALLNDFGLCNVFDTSKPNALFSSTSVSSPLYKSPEVLNAKKNNSSYMARSLDMWSLGVLYYEMVTGYWPFFPQTLHSDEDALELELESLILKRVVDFQCLSSFPHVSTVIQQLLEYDVDRRLSNWKDIKHSDWMASQRRLLC